MGSTRRFVIDVVDTGGFQTIAEFFGSFGMFFRTDTQEKYVDVIIECLAVFEDSVISCVYILQVDIACSAEATDISKLVRVIQRGVKSEKTTS